MTESTNLEPTGTPALDLVDISDRLRAPFPADQVERNYDGAPFVGHAAVTDRLLAADPAWTWEPMAFGPDGLPAIGTEPDGSAVLWIWMTVGGVRRPAVGNEVAEITLRKNGEIQPTTDLNKKLVSDAIRNGAMRFGVALGLWSKADLSTRDSGARHGHDVIEAADPEAVKALRPLAQSLPEAAATELRGFLRGARVNLTSGAATASAFEAAAAEIQRLVGLTEDQQSVTTPADTDSSHARTEPEAA